VIYCAGRENAAANAKNQDPVEDKKAGKKIGAKKSSVFIFLPPSFCLSLFGCPTFLFTPHAGNCGPCRLA
jgi:hypothetical protein